MIGVTILRRNWGKVVVSLVAVVILYTFLPIDDIEESFGLTSGRMAFIQNNGRLAPFPKMDVGLWISHRASFFTNIYRVHIKSRPDIIADWLKRSPGVTEGRSELLPGGATRYHLKTWGIVGYLDVSPDGRQVGIKMGEAWDGIDVRGTPALVPSGQGPL